MARYEVRTVVDWTEEFEAESEVEAEQLAWTEFLTNQPNLSVEIRELPEDEED